MISLSSAAVQEVKRLQSKQPHSPAFLRVGIAPGGCADWIYTLDFDDQVREGDRLYDQNGLKIVMDAQQLEVLANLTLDYSEDLMGGGFRFHNPQAARTCGCGNSFSTELVIDTGSQK